MLSTIRSLLNICFVRPIMRWFDRREGRKLAKIAAEVLAARKARKSS